MVQQDKNINTEPSSETPNPEHISGPLGRLIAKLESDIAPDSIGEERPVKAVEEAAPESDSNNQS